MPKLPVATAFWTPQPDLATGAEAWILAGGAHHTAFSYDITAEQMGDWAEAMGIEAVYIDKDTQIRNFKNELKWNSMYYKLEQIIVPITGWSKKMTDKNQIIKEIRAGKPAWESNSVPPESKRFW